MYRCILSPNKELYVLVIPEKLTLENQDYLALIIHRLVRHNLMHEQFNFGVVTSDSYSSNSNNSSIYNFLRSQEYTRILKDQNILTEENLKHIISSVDRTTHFVTSREAGLGKSH
jgi:hypothetical protein